MTDGFHKKRMTVKFQKHLEARPGRAASAPVHVPPSRANSANSALLDGPDKTPLCWLFNDVLRPSNPPPRHPVNSGVNPSFVRSTAEIDPGASFDLNLTEFRRRSAHKPEVSVSDEKEERKMDRNMELCPSFSKLIAFWLLPAGSTSGLDIMCRLTQRALGVLRPPPLIPVGQSPLKRRPSGPKS
ncbi:uncharacterized protein KD926_000518 [Aspergillus affinis]|uniref:uncharacterized protein n=1 Tax=Aspergillus affinis TaxID=1070780 RepID=UPI0022FDCF7F|nr:uncharacterized protein KD926_000518 [Aspergillus affinis]KAI9044607.1 hypothetical protein KD926_000518 [Aspergillus affinis]